MGDDNRTVLDTTRADRAVWLMKCPPVVSRSWSSSAAASDPALPAPVVAKVVLTLDLLQPDQPPTFKMELAKNEPGNTPKSYSLNMHKDFVPMCVFTESASGKLSLEGKVDHKFDMEPHSENFAQYDKLCRERTTKSMIKNRQVQVYTDDHGGNMNPMPGMLGLMSSSVSKAEKKSGPHCERCGLSLSSKTANKLKHESEQLLCSHCDKLLISKQYCGICKKLWHPTDDGSWVRCDDCRVWIHVECNKACSNLKDLEHAGYFCPDCNREKKHSQVRDENKSWLDSQSDKLTVCCAGVEGTYLLDEHAVLCHCGSCKTQMQTLTEWERHTGCRHKKWRRSVKVKITMEPLGKWVCTQERLN